MNYDSYLARAIEIFNDKMDADFSRDNVILTCFMTDDQEEIFEQFCAQYFPYGCTTGIRRKATSISGHPPLSGWTTEVRTASCSARTYPTILLSCFISSCMSWRTFTASITNWMGKAFMTNTVKAMAHSNEEDGMINAGYAVWRECIAEIIAIECDDNCDIFPIRDKKKMLAQLRDEINQLDGKLLVSEILTR